MQLVPELNMRRSVAAVVSVVVVVGVSLGKWRAPVLHAQQTPRGAEQTEDVERTYLRFAPRVTSLDELQPRTPEDHARLKIVDHMGGRRLEPGDVVFRIVDRKVEITREPLLYAEIVNRLACSAPVIVVGAPVPSRVLLNRSGTFLYTEYTVVPNRTIVRRVPMPFGGRIEWITPGGEVTIGDERIVADSGGSLWRNTQYLLFFALVPNSTAFRVAQTPIPWEPPHWDLVLPYSPVPPEFKTPSVRFETFLDDLELAARWYPVGK
jgi:hypothetical protein